MAYSKARRLADIVVDTNGNINVPTQSASDNDTSAASTAYVTTAVSGLIDSAPSTLNTLNEIAAALNDDANFNTTVTNSIAAKLPLAGGTMTGHLLLNNAIELRTKDTGANVRTIARVNSSDQLQYGWSGSGPVMFMGGGSYTERMRIHTNGNIGIGLTSPSEKLHIYGTGATISGKVEAGDGNQASLDLKNSEGEFRLICDGGELSIFDQTDSTERFRINTSGVVTVGVSTFADGTGGTSIAGGLVKISNDSTSNGTQMFFTNPNGAVGSISSSGSATAYNTSSDVRLKDVTGSARGLEVINELNPVAYNWKADGKADEGLIAQEVLDVVPNAVSGSEEDMYQMDYSKLVVHLVAGMKEQQKQIEALQSEINELKNS